MKYLLGLFYRIPHIIAVAIILYFNVSNSVQPTATPEDYIGYDVFTGLLQGSLISIPILLFPAILMLLYPNRRAVLRDWFGKTNCTIWQGISLFVLISLCSLALLTVVNPTEEQSILASFQQLKGSEMLIISTIICIIVPIVEEILFRGVLMQNLPTKFAIIFSAVFFALAHGSSIYLLPLFFTGWALAVVRAYTGSLYVTICCHIAFNTQSILVTYFNL